MKRTTKKLIINSVIIALIVAGALWIGSLFFHGGNVVYTNNAQVRQDIVSIQSRIQGYVKQIYVDEFSPVKRGDTLMIIEDAQYQLEVARAEAALKLAQAGMGVQSRTVQTADNAVAINRANIEEVRVRMENARTEYERYQKLYEQDAVTRQQMESKQTDYEALVARYESMKAATKGARLNTDEQQERLAQSGATIEEAQTRLELARLNLSYTVITAPCDGYTARRMVQQGELMQPGRTVFTVVSTERIWVIANMKERELQHVDVGSEVSMTVDAVPGVTFTGKVTAISDATGAQYSPNPTDNSAGNFVKVEGRIPVKISIDKATDDKAMRKLRSGMNVEVEVEVKY